MDLETAAMYAAQAAGSLRAEIRAALASPPESDPAPGEPERLASLAGSLAHTCDQITWCRDAALALARRHPDPEGRASWTRLQTEAGIADATLIGRWQRWISRNGGAR